LRRLSRSPRTAATSSRRSWTSEAISPLGLDRLGLGHAHLGDDAVVLTADAARELRALDQVGEAVGVEDDAEDVGRVALVELDQAAGQGAAAFDQLGLEAREPGALGAQVVLDPRQPVELGVQIRLQARLPGLKPRDVGLQRIDPRAEAADISRQHALLRALGVDLVLLLLDAGGERRRPARNRHEQGKRHRQQEKAERHAVAMVRGIPACHDG
jgi:hypothetical protein